MEDKKKYNYMENVLQTINKNYISLSDDEVKRNNRVLEEVLNQIISKMKATNPLFNKMFQRVFYGGSYYDGLRVGNPEEFDLDLLLKLPVYAEPDLTTSNIPGFVHLQLKEMEKFEKQPEAHLYKGLEKLLDNKHYLVTSEVSSWIEGIVNKALNDFEKSGNDTIFNTTSGKFKARTVKGGPAFTLKMEGNVGGKLVKMDVDLVPCFIFGKEKWPPSPCRKNAVTEKPDFFIVPKRPGGTADVKRYWRLSFQEQERVLINSYRTLKPTVKLLKKLRDMLDHKIIASYFIKTVFLWEVEKEKQLFNDNSLSYVFMTMLKKYKLTIEQGKIPYYWNKNNNLVEKANPVALQNIANRLKAIIDDIEKHPQDPYIVCKYLVKSDQMEKLKSEVVIGKKTLKQLQQLQISPPQPTGSNGMVSSPIQNTKSSSTVNTEMIDLIAEIVQTKLTQTNLSAKHSILPNLQLVAHQTCQKCKLCGNASATTTPTSSASCTLDEVDARSAMRPEGILLSTINKLQESATKLTLAVETLQNDNRKLFDAMQNVSGKIEDINTNLRDLKSENQMLHTKLKGLTVEKRENDIDDFCFLSDTLALTARRSANLH